MLTSLWRLVQNNEEIDDQVDFLAGDVFTRIVGITVPQLSLKVFFNNQLQSWPLINGQGITDAQVVSGSVYFNEIAGAPGYYSVRWRPSGVGFWRLVLNYAAGQQTVALGYDVKSEAPLIDSSLSASFIKPRC
jgi:hypothetical protein